MERGICWYFYCDHNSDDFPYRIVSTTLLANQLIISLTGQELQGKLKGTPRSPFIGFCTSNAVNCIARSNLIASDNYETTKVSSDQSETDSIVL